MYNKNFFTFFLLTLLFVSPLAASDEAIKKSSTKQIAFLYYKMIDRVPDYDLWTHEYTKADIDNYGQLGKREYVHKVRTKLMNDFYNVKPETDLIMVQIHANLEPLTFEGTKQDKVYFNIYFDESPPFIAKRIPEFNINIVVPDLEEKVRLSMSKFDYDRLNKTFYGGIRKRNDVMLQLTLKPIVADVENPIIRNDKKYALLLTKLLEYEIFNDSGKRRLWPLPPTEEEIKAQDDKEKKDNFFNKYGGQ